MALEWMMVDEHLDDPEDIVKWLRQGYEPFAVTDSRCYLKKLVNIERDVKASDLIEVAPDVHASPPDES